MLGHFFPFANACTFGKTKKRALKNRLVRVWNFGPGRGAFVLHQDRDKTEPRLAQGAEKKTPKRGKREEQNRKGKPTQTGWPGWVFKS